jgi:protein gp37
MCDVFDPEGPEHLRAKLFEIIGDTPYLFWMLLTKRPELVKGVMPGLWERSIPSNVAIGATVENQEMADKRIPELLSISARYHFVSHEPALGPIDYTHIDAESNGHPEWCVINALTGRQTDMGRPCPDVPHLNLVITGGESGKDARPMHPNWARADRDQCQAAGVKFCFKQWGEWGPDFEAAETCLDCGATKYDAGVSNSRWVDDRIDDEECGDCGSQCWEKADPSFLWPSDWALAKLGKKCSGRVLDGETWNERLV